MIHVKHALPDGTVVLVDDSDMAEFVVKAAEWALIRLRPDREQRALVEKAVLEARTSGDPRTEADQQTMETAQNASTGEAHQEQEDRQ